MADLFILIKRKGSNKVIGAIPIKSRANIQKMGSLVPKAIKSRFNTRIVTKTQLKALISNIKPKQSKTKGRKRVFKRAKKRVRRRRKR
jgi:hypothetical protein